MSYAQGIGIATKMLGYVNSLPSNARLKAWKLTYREGLSLAEYVGQITEKNPADIFEAMAKDMSHIMGAKVRLIGDYR